MSARRVGDPRPEDGPWPTVDAGDRGRRCLVLHPGALGDVLLALPALAHLGALGLAPVVAAAGRLAGLLALASPVAATRDLEDLRLHRLFAEPLDPGVLDELRGHAAVVSWLGAGDPVYRGHLARLDRPVVVAHARPPGGRHAARHLLETLAPLGPLPPGLPVARLSPPVAEREAVAGWLGERGLAPGAAVVLQAGAGAAAKAWPGFPGLLRALRAAGVPAVALAGPADREAVERLLAAGLDEARVARDFSLPRLAALLQAARALVGNDSGPTHLAAVSGCPTVALFGPTDPAVWAPVGARVRVVAPAAGGPDRAGEPWRGVDADRVLAALSELGGLRASRWAAA